MSRSRVVDWYDTVPHLFMPNLDGQLERPQPFVALKTIWGVRYDFFLSYRHEESQQYVSALASKLTDAGFRVFLASEQVLPVGNDDALRRSLVDALHASAAIVHVLSKTPFGGEWTRFESEVFYEGRFGLTIGLFTEVTPEDQFTIWNIRRQFDSIVIHEETAGAWEQGEPSITTVLNLALGLSLYKVSLRMKPWVWLVPQSLRMRLHDALVRRNAACRKWLGHFLIYHGLVEPPPELLELLERSKSDPS